MKQFLIKAWARFKSEVPPVVKKVQVLAGMAAASFTTASTTIPWTGKLSAVGDFCGYGAAACAAVVIGLQFTERAIKEFKTDQTKQP